MNNGKAFFLIKKKMINILSDNKLKQKIDQISKMVGNTPLFPITKLHSNKDVKIYAKLEWQQLGGSIKSRPAFRIIKDAISNGLLHEEKVILDASSGNTGIAFAAIGASLGLDVTICLPENASNERKTLLKAFGATIVYTSKFGSTDEAQQIAMEMYEKNPEKYFYADQYNNESNWKAHYDHTAEEIYSQTRGSITHFVAGLGTSGTFTGVGRKLKELNHDVQMIALQPDTIMHGLEGWKNFETAKIPGIYDSSIQDAQMEINTHDAYELIRETSKAEGLLLSPSAAANLAGALKLSQQLDHGTIVTVFADDASKYGDVLKAIF